MTTTIRQRFTVLCSDCGEHARNLPENRAWDEANAHERATGHTTRVICGCQYSGGDIVRFCDRAPEHDGPHSGDASPR